MITDLYHIFKKFDKVTFSDAKIYDSNFKMGTINKDKIFDVFYIRFCARVAFFNYNNDQKISFIKRNFLDKLVYKIVNGIMERSFPQFANKCRTIDIEVG